MILTKKIPGCENNAEDDVRDWIDLNGASESLGQEEIVAAKKGYETEKVMKAGDWEDVMKSSTQGEKDESQWVTNALKEHCVICNNKNGLQ